MCKKIDKELAADLPASSTLEGLLDQLRMLIQDARQQALRAVDIVQVRTCWEVGRHIVEYEQGGADRAQYGAKLNTQAGRAVDGRVW